MSLEQALERRAERVEALRKTCTDIFGEHRSFTFEIGSGKGHYLSSYAAANPSEICVGIDLISDRVRDAARRAKNKNAQNAHFVKADAMEFLDALPQSVRIDKIFIFFPDPWPKERHHKRRLIKDEFLDTIRQFVRADSKLYFRTDYDEYFQWATDVFKNNSSWELLPDNTLPFEEVSQFQRILPNFNTLVARAI